MLKLTERWFDIPPRMKNHPVHQQLIKDIDNRLYKNYIIAASRRSGKSERHIKRRIVLEAIRNKNWELYASAPTVGQARQLFWTDLKALIPNELIKKVYETLLIIELYNGSVIHVVGLDAHRRIQGSRFHFFGISETQLVAQEVFTETLFPILADVKESILVAEGRPLGKGNYFYTLFQRGLDPIYPEYNSYHWTGEEILDPAQIEQAKRDLSEQDYRREFDASFETAASQPYHSYTPDNHKILELNPNERIIIACDFNAGEKPMSWVVGQELIDNNRKILYWHKEFYLPYTNTYEMSDIVIQWLIKNYPTSKVRFYGDYAGFSRTSNSSVSDWTIIEQKFSNFITSKNDIVAYPIKSVRDTVGASNAMLCNALGERRMFVNPKGCPNLIQDWILCEWDKTDTRLNENDPKRGHLCRAVDYCVNALYPIYGKNRVAFY